VFFTVDVVVYFRIPSTTAKFFITSLLLIRISVLIHMSCGGILVRLQKTRCEVLCGVFRALFGSFLEFTLAEFTLATITFLQNDAPLAVRNTALWIRWKSYGLQLLDCTAYVKGYLFYIVLAYSQNLLLYRPLRRIELPQHHG
jgi:hypothetical protein